MFVLAWMLIRFLQGIIEVLIRGRHLQKFALIRNNAREIIAKTDMICAIVIGLWLVLSTLRTWKVYADIGTPLADILAFGVTIGERHFSLGLILAAGAFLYGAFLVSWSLQSLVAGRGHPFAQDAAGRADFHGPADALCHCAGGVFADPVGAGG